MDSQRMIDSLTAHIALYHSASSHPSPKPSPNPRSTILRWFASLSVPHRQSALTALDPDFLRLLLRMLSRLRRHGHGFFFLLPDLPSPSAASLPSLCFRASDGLLARAAASDASSRSIARSLLLFSSREGERDCPLDSFTVSEGFVADVDLFVEAMDGISSGRFLRGEVSPNDLGSPWVELLWLKDKGYYSVEAFVANKLEVALRLSWLSSHGGKKQKGMKSKDKGGTTGVAANAFWRKKGCLDWWSGLDSQHRKKIFTAFLGKAAKLLINEAVKGPTTATENQICFSDVEAELPLRCGPTASWKREKQSFFKGCSDLCLDMIAVPSSGKLCIVANSFNRLLVLHEISAMRLACQPSELEIERLFFSKLGSAHTMSDCILRKLRDLLMVVSTDYTNLELLEDIKLKTLSNNTGEKLKIGCRKGKNKSRNSKKSNDIPKPIKDHGCRGDFRDDRSSRIWHQENTLCLMPNQRTGTLGSCGLQKDLRNETSVLEHEMESAVRLVDCQGHTDKKKNGRRGGKGKTTTSKKVGSSGLENKKNALPSVAAESEIAKSVGFTGPVTVHPISNDIAIRGNVSVISSFCNASNRVDKVDNTETMKSSEVDHVLHSIADSCVSGAECVPNSDKTEDDDMLKRVSPYLAKDEELLKTKSAESFIINTCLVGHCEDSPIRCSTNSHSREGMGPPLPILEFGNAMIDDDLGHHSSGCISDTTTQPVVLPNSSQTVMIANVNNHTNSMGVISFEWPSMAPLNFTSVSSQHLPATTDRLHLDVGRKWPTHFHQSFLPSRPQARNSLLEGAQSLLPPPSLPTSFDWPLMVNSCSRLSQTVALSYDSGCLPGVQSSICTGFAAHGMQINGTASENERKHYGDIVEVNDLKNASELADDAESYWWSEEESDSHAFSGRDYNQFFGGGVMYWNSAEHVGTGFSRPPSHSSEDSSWAWREADLNRAIDDMVGLPGMSTPYSTNGLASPPAASFCSPFDSLGTGLQAVGYAMSGIDGHGKVLHSSLVSDVPEEKVSRTVSNSPRGIEGVKGDQLPYPMLRPIIVPSISRKGSRSEFKLGHDHKSPCVPSTRRDPPRIKRPPSPVVLCVPPVPRPPPPSPVGEARKRGFPIVRSGSSSPRHWGMRSLYHEESTYEETRLCLDGAEVVWPSWGNKGLAANPLMQSIQGSLLQGHLITMSQLALDQEHPDIKLPVQPPDLLDCPSQKISLSTMHSLLHEEIETFCKKVAAENLIKKPYINWAVKRVTRSLQVLWPRSRTNIFGSNATGLALPTSDVDLVVSLPPVRNLEPIKEAGILEGRNGIKETCLQHAARYLANQEWVRNDSLKTVENTTIPVIMLVVEVPDEIKFSNGSSPIVDTSQSQAAKMPREEVCVLYCDLSSSENTSLPMYSEIRKDSVNDVKSIRLDISFKSPSHTGLQTSELVRELTQQFPASIPLSLVLKMFLADRSLDHSYSGGLSSYCLILLITRFLQHEHHIGRPITQNLGSLLMDFLYFFGNIFDPRQMRISIQGSGVYMNRERGLSIDPIHIDDPLYPTNNVGRNCFRIHQCIKAFADAYAVLENELPVLSGNCANTTRASFRLLPKIIPSIGREE